MINVDLDTTPTHLHAPARMRRRYNAQRIATVLKRHIISNSSLIVSAIFASYAYITISQSATCTVYIHTLCSAATSSVIIARLLTVTTR